VGVEVHVTGRIETGRFADFVAALGPWAAYREAKGHARARVCQALSGPMNQVRMVFEYPDLNAYEGEERVDALDPEYARLAGAMPFVDGTLRYELYLPLTD
jgi:hypothetical protein